MGNILNLAKEIEKVSELITNMCESNAGRGEMKRVIDYSMVVIDTFRYETRCKQSKIDNNISAIEEKYMNLNKENTDMDLNENKIVKNKVEPQEYIYKQTPIEAIEFNGDNGEACVNYINDISGEQTAKVVKEANIFGVEHQILEVENSNGIASAYPGDYIVRGADDEFFVRKRELFVTTYIKKGSDY